MATRIAILGTGRMGSTIARRLAGAGHDIIVWSRTPEHAEAVGVGRVAETPADAVRSAEMVISSLTGPEALRAVYLGAHGAVEAAAGQVFVEMSTAGPAILAALEPPLTARGARLLAVPIMGAPTAVALGKGILLAGGDERSVEQARVVLEMLGTVRPVGSLDDAARLKLVANSMLADVMLAAAELQVAGEAAGLEPDDVFWVLSRVAPVLESRRPGLIEGRHTPTLFAMRDLHKDLDLALTLFGESAAQTPLTRWSSERVGAAAAATPDLDISAVARAYREAGRAPAIPAARAAKG
jgi:3-hydroxyisobutyrate dehydrogenase-like beta-hydroxyacid dehydrogenase